MIIGGATLYPLLTRSQSALYYRDDAEQGDTHFKWTDDAFKLQAEEFRPKDAKNSYDLTLYLRAD